MISITILPGTFHPFVVGAVSDFVFPGEAVETDSLFSHLIVPLANLEFFEVIAILQFVCTHLALCTFEGAWVPLQLLEQCFHFCFSNLDYFFVGIDR